MRNTKGKYQMFLWAILWMAILLPCCLKQQVKLDIFPDLPISQSSGINKSRISCGDFVQKTDLTVNKTNQQKQNLLEEDFIVPAQINFGITTVQFPNWAFYQYISHKIPLYLQFQRLLLDFQ